MYVYGSALPHPPPPRGIVTPRYFQNSELILTPSYQLESLPFSLALIHY